MEKRDIRHLRKQYDFGALEESTASDDPYEQFDRWFQDAVKSDVFEPNAFALSTASPDGVPSCRIVLLKEYDADGFVFYTNYGSRKGSEIRDNNRVAMLFYWDGLARQVRIEGRARKVKRSESVDYFDARPEESKVSAIISPQSQRVTDRDELRAKKEDYLSSNKGTKCPRYWGGYRIKPSRFEFWQGRPNRLHDRLVYTWRRNKKVWTVDRLAP